MAICLSYGPLLRSFPRHTRGCAAIRSAGKGRLSIASASLVTRLERCSGGPRQSRSAFQVGCPPEQVTPQLQLQLVGASQDAGWHLDQLLDVGPQAAALGGVAVTVAKNALPQIPEQSEGVESQGFRPQDQGVGLERPAWNPLQVEFAFDFSLILLGGRVLAVAFHDVGYRKVQAGDLCLYPEDDPTLHQQALTCWYSFQLPAQALGDPQDPAHLHLHPVEIARLEAAVLSRLFIISRTRFALASSPSQILVNADVNSLDLEDGGLPVALTAVTRKAARTHWASCPI